MANQYVPPYGDHAFLHGFSRTANPYPKPSHMAAEWDRSWLKAMREHAETETRQGHRAIITSANNLDELKEALIVIGESRGWF